MNIQRAIDRNISFGNKRGEIDNMLELHMLTEEVEEIMEAMKANDNVEIVDGLIDLIFVAIGTLHKLGLSKKAIERVREEVCNSNFTKFPMEKDENGKVKKSDSFVQPFLEGILIDEGVVLYK